MYSLAQFSILSQTNATFVNILVSMYYLVTQTLKGNEKQFDLAGVWVIGVGWIPNLPC